MHNKKFKLNDKTQSIEELWETLHQFAKNRVEDNKKYEDFYPLETRELQMNTLRCLVKSIDHTHSQMRKLTNGVK